MTTKTDITLLPCPCCGAPAVTGADAEYENSNGDPAVECSVCNVMSWTVEDWNRRATVEADRADYLRDTTKMVPNDVWVLIEKYADAVTKFNEAVRAVSSPDAGIDEAEAGCLTTERELRALLSRYSSSQPTESRRDVLMSVLGKLNSNPYNLTKAECINVVRGMLDDAGDRNTDEGAVDHFSVASASLGHPVRISVAQEPVYQVQYNHEGWRDASASRYEAVGKAMAYSDASRWERRIVYAAPVAAQAQPGDPHKSLFEAAIRDLAAISEHLGLDPDDGGAVPIIEAINELRNERDQWADAGYAAQAQPCDHVYEARPIDGSRSAVALVEAVCRKCGARGDASLTPDMQRDEKRGAESGQDHDTALADTQRQIIEAAERRGYARAEAENVGYRTDAGRYRLLRRGQHWGVIDGGGNTLRADTLDAAIDAARVAKGE
jgi:hypothetical protein